MPCVATTNDAMCRESVRRCAAAKKKWLSICWYCVLLKSMRCQTNNINQFQIFPCRHNSICAHCIICYMLWVCLACIASHTTKRHTIWCATHYVLSSAHVQRNANMHRINIYSYFLLVRFSAMFQSFHFHSTSIFYFVRRFDTRVPVSFSLLSVVLYLRALRLLSFNQCHHSNTSNLDFFFEVALKSVAAVAVGQCIIRSSVWPQCVRDQNI